MNPVIAATSWAEASIWIAVIAFSGIVLAVAIHSVMGVGKTAVANDGSGQAARTNDLLEQLATDVADVRTRITEVERLLKDV